MDSGSALMTMVDYHFIFLTTLAVDKINRRGIAMVAFVGLSIYIHRERPAIIAAFAFGTLALGTTLGTVV